MTENMYKYMMGQILFVAAQKYSLENLEEEIVEKQKKLWDSLERKEKDELNEVKEKINKSNYLSNLLSELEEVFNLNIYFPKEVHKKEK